MKKTSTLALALTLCFSTNADTTLKMLNFGSEEGPGLGEPGMLGLGISPNGRYICGTIEGGMGTVIGDIETDRMIYNISDEDSGGQLINVNNEGTAIGYDGDRGIRYTINGEESTLRVPQNYMYVLGQDISEDGSVEVGFMVEQSFLMLPAYSKNGGTWETLPIPDVDMSYFNTQQIGARYVSSDGKIIVGNIGYLGPATLWRLDDNGEYIADPIFDKYVMRSREDKTHPYFSFTPEGMSPDGHYVLIEVRTYINESVGPAMPAIYDTQNRELIVYSEKQTIDEFGTGLHPTAIADNRTFIGMIGSPSTNVGAFIMFAGETQAQKYTEAFPEYSEVFDFLDLAGYHVPADISADGGHILGNGWYSADENPESPGAFYYFMTYVIETTEHVSVKEIDNDVQDVMPIGYYSIDGIRKLRPTKGLNIIMMSDGTVRKEMI